MDQQLLDAWLSLEGDSQDASKNGTAAENGRGALPTGHAWFVREDDLDDDVMLLACEQRDRLEPLLRHVSLQLRARSITVMIENSAVPVVVVLLRIQGAEEAVLFSAWVNELSPRTEGILSCLARQPQLMIALLDEHGRTVGTAAARNVLASKMEALRDWIANVAQTSPWSRAQFAAAKAHIRSQHPTNEDLWERFEEDSSSQVAEPELTAASA